MKLYISAAVILISALAFTSCKKVHTCSCYSPDLNRTAPSFEVKGSKKNAGEECSATSKTGMYTGTDYVCNLK